MNFLSVLCNGPFLKLCNEVSCLLRGRKASYVTCFQASCTPHVASLQKGWECSRGRGRQWVSYVHTLSLMADACWTTRMSFAAATSSIPVLHQATSSITTSSCQLEAYLNQVSQPPFFVTILSHSIAHFMSRIFQMSQQLQISSTSIIEISLFGHAILQLACPTSIAGQMKNKSYQ